MRPALKLTIALLACTPAAFGWSQATPKPQTPAQLKLQQKLKATEDKMAKMAAGHQKLMAQLAQIEASMDQLQKQLHAMRMKIEGK